MADMEDNLTEKLRPLGLDREMVKGTIHGAREQMIKQLPTTEAFFDCYVEYIKTIAAVLGILDEEYGRWRVGDAGLVFEDELKLEAVQQLLESIGALEAKTQLLSEQVVEGL